MAECRASSDYSRRSKLFSQKDLKTIQSCREVVRRGSFCLLDCGQDAHEGCDTTCKPGVSTDTSAPIPARAAGPRVGPPQGLLSLPPSGFSKGHLDLHPARLKRDHVGVRRSGGNSH